MTAVVGILNKKGVAIAADSAVTVGNLYQRKVYNSANKIFMLSKYHPVGIAIYSNADFMGIPWEVIIKEYRNFIGNHSFDNVALYRDNFLEWLIEERELFTDERNDEYLINDLYKLLDTAFLGAEAIISSEEERKQSLMDYFKRVKEYVTDYKTIIEDVGSIISLLEEFKDSIIEITARSIQVKITTDEANRILEAYAIYLSKSWFLNYTGLVFVGYGNKELFPRIFPVNVSIAVGSHLRFYFDTESEAIVSKETTAYVRPFAQTDVIETILQGISPDTLVAIQESFNDFFKTFFMAGSLLPNLSEERKMALSEAMTEARLQELFRPFYNDLRGKIMKNHTWPMLDTVSHLDKEDLAEMAESLIYLTYLKRRFTMEEESVGGPVDVAIITKGDGFIWIKRKHYFEPQLNNHFFQKYYK